MNARKYPQDKKSISEKPNWSDQFLPCGKPFLLEKQSQEYWLNRPRECLNQQYTWLQIIDFSNCVGRIGLKMAINKLFSQVFLQLHHRTECSPSIKFQKKFVKLCNTDLRFLLRMIDISEETYTKKLCDYDENYLTFSP